MGIMAEDRNRPSTSEELLRRATESIKGAPADGYDGGFTPTSPADAFASSTGGSRTDADGGTGDTSPDGLTAEEIAHTLGGLQEPPIDVPDAARAAATASVADRIRRLSSQSETDVAGVPSDPPRPDPTMEEAPRAGDVLTWDGDRWSTPTPEWQAREAAATASTRRSIPIPSIRAVVSLVVFGVMGVGLLISALDGKAPVQDLSVGECFIVGDALEVNELPVVDCSEEHDAELFARVAITGFGSTHPGDDAVFDWLYDQCLDRFPSYVGEPYEESEFWIDMFIPTTEGWADGDRTGLCTAVMVDGDLDIRSHTRTAQSSGASA